MKFQQSNNKRIILFINTSWNIYNFRSGLIKALQRNGYEIHALAPEDSYSVHLVALGCVYHPVSMKNTGSNLMVEIALIRRIYKLYREIRPWMVLHYTVKPNLYGTLAAFWLKIPSICTVSGLGTVFLTSGKASQIAKLLYKRAFRFPRMIFFHNQADLELFKNHGLLPKVNYQVIPGSGIDVRRFTSASKSANRPPFVFLMMARIIEDKGIREYLEAAAILLDQGLAVKCQLLGALETDHKRSISLSEINAGAVEYLGETDDVRNYLEQAHAVVLPSYREGLPKSLLEAAAMQKPMVASDVPGCREVVKDEINGLLCKPRNAIDLAKKMKEIYDLSSARLDEMGLAGRQLIIQHFTEELVINKYLETISHIEQYRSHEIY